MARPWRAEGVADLFVFVLILVVVIAGAVTLGMIVATRIDRIQNPAENRARQPPQERNDAEPDVRAPEEHQP